MSFLRAWTTQGLWVSLTLTAALVAITGEIQDTKTFNAYDWVVLIIGFFIWILGFIFEVTADHQKNKWNSVTENQGKFINTSGRVSSA